MPASDNLNAQQFKISPSGPLFNPKKPSIPFQINPSGPVYEHVHDPEVVQDKPAKRGLRQRLGDLNDRMWGLN